MDDLGNGCFVFSAEGEKSLKVTKVVFPTVLALGGIEGSVGWTCGEKSSALGRPRVEIFVHCHLFVCDVLCHNLDLKAPVLQSGCRLSPTSVGSVV